MSDCITLNSPWFELVRDGKKKYEGRRFTTRFYVGQRLAVRHHTREDVSPYTIEITEILQYPSFEEALTNLLIRDVLPIDGITVEKGVDIYKQYVSYNTKMV